MGESGRLLGYAGCGERGVVIHPPQHPPTPTSARVSHAVTLFNTDIWFLLLWWDQGDHESTAGLQFVTQNIGIVGVAPKGTWSCEKLFSMFDGITFIPYSFIVFALKNSFKEHLLYHSNWTTVLLTRSV